MQVCKLRSSVKLAVAELASACSQGMHSTRSAASSGLWQAGGTPHSHLNPGVARKAWMDWTVALREYIHAHVGVFPGAG